MLRSNRSRAELAQEPIRVPTASGTRLLGVDLFDIGLATALYDDSSWRTVAGAIEDVDGTGGSTLLALVDRQTGRQPDGSFDNSSDAQLMVSYADESERPTIDEATEDAEAIIQAAPMFGPVTAWGGLELSRLRRWRRTRCPS